MVEDEFYAVAQSFTQHLHYAEYVRRKKEVKARSAAEIGEIERPVDGRTEMPKELVWKKEAEALAARQKRGLAPPEEPGNETKDDTDDDDDTWAGTHLYDLMTSPRKVRSLPGAFALKSSTKAAAGFVQASGTNGLRQKMAGSSRIFPNGETQSHSLEAGNETASEEDDDLDGHACPVTVASTRRPESNVSTRTSETPTPVARRRIAAVQKTPTLEKQKSIPARNSNKPRSAFKSRVQMLFDDLDELPEPSRSNASTSDPKIESSSGSNASRGASGKNSLESGSRANDVPTFLLR